MLIMCQVLTLQIITSLLFLQVGRVGNPAVCADALAATWYACGRDLTPASNKGAIEVDLSLPSAIAAFDATATIITCPGDAAALQPIALPLNTSLSAQLQFPDGTQMSIMDSRASFALTTASAAGCLLQHDEAAGTVTLQSADSPCAAAQCTVQLTYPTLNASLSAQITVSVVLVEELLVYSQAYNKPAACAQVPPDATLAAPTLHPLACSLTDYQQATVCAVAQLSASAGNASGQQVDVTAQAAFASSDDSTVTLLPNLAEAGVINRIRPLVPGTANIRAIFGGKPSSDLSVTGTAAGAAVAVQAFELGWAGSALQASADGCTDLCNSTFAAIAGTAAALTMALTLSDGYTYDAASLLGTANAALDVLDVSAIFSFASSLPSTVSLGAYGDARLLQNADELIALEAETTCTADSSALASDVSVYANLLPASLDVDTGSRYGPALSQEGSASAVTPIQVCSYLPTSLQICCSEPCMVRCSGRLWVQYGFWRLLIC